MNNFEWIVSILFVWIMLMFTMTAGDPSGQWIWCEICESYYSTMEGEPCPFVHPEEVARAHER